MFRWVLHEMVNAPGITSQYLGVTLDVVSNSERNLAEFFLLQRTKAAQLTHGDTSLFPVTNIVVQWLMYEKLSTPWCLITSDKQNNEEYHLCLP